MQLRLDRLVCSQTGMSRREAKELIRKREILLNGKPCTAEEKVDPQVDTVSVKGETIFYRQYLYVMLNKPKGVVSATEDEVHRTVLDLLPEPLKRKGMFPAGRLDKDTRGFVLLTDDGAFAHDILSPRNHVEKTYLLQTDIPMDASDVEAFAQGIAIGGGDVCMPAMLRAVAPLDFRTACQGVYVRAGSFCYGEITIREGMYHQIRRMLQMRGKRVIELKRVKIGGLQLLGSLPEGQARMLTQEEIAQLRAGKQSD